MYRLWRTTHHSIIITLWTTKAVPEYRPFYVSMTVPDCCCRCVWCSPCSMAGIAGRTVGRSFGPCRSSCCECVWNGGNFIFRLFEDSFNWNREIFLCSRMLFYVRKCFNRIKESKLFAPPPTHHLITAAGLALSLLKSISNGWEGFKIVLLRAGEYEKGLKGRIGTLEGREDKMVIRDLSLIGGKEILFSVPWKFL